MTDASPQAIAELPAPEELAGYRALRLLGSGGTGPVYEVRGRHDEPLAVKVIPGAAPRTTEDAQRLRRELRALTMIDHPRLVRVYDLAPAGRDLLVVMELLPGPSLREVFQTRRPAPEEVSAWVTQLADAIDYLHLLGLVHHDVKPANVLIAGEGSVKLADLGLGDIHPVQGTPTYMAPELARGDRLVDGRADVYSLATIAYEGLAGLPPFHGRSPEDVMTAQVRTPPPDPRTHVAGFPAAVGEVLLRGLAKQPEDRPETAGAFAEALAAALKGRRPPSSGAIVPARGQEEEALRTRPAPLPATKGRAEPLPRLIADIPAPARMSRPMLISGLILILIAASVLGYGGYVGYRHFFVPQPFAVTAVTFTSNPAEIRVANCATSASFAFTATVTTNRRPGEIHYQWIEQQTTQAGAQYWVEIGGLTGTQRVSTGQRTATIETTLQTDPGNNVSLPVKFEVTSPGHHTSAPVQVTYTCH